MNKNEVLENIRLIEKAGEALGDKYVIKNGIATLANDVFIFCPVQTDDNYHYLVREGKDVASALEYANPSNALNVHVEKEDKTSYLIRVSGSKYKANICFINESGL